MKNIYVFLIFFLFQLGLCAQEHVVVLVDVSKSIKQSHFVEARSTVRQLLIGEKITSSNFTADLDTKSKVTLGKAFIGKGSKVLIMPFGETKWMVGPFSPKVMRNFPKDLDQYFEAIYPKSVTDNKTYLQLAEAKAAQVAKSQGMERYYLLIVSDNINDDYGPSKRPVYTKAQRHLLDNFRMESHPYLAPKQGTIDFTPDDFYNIRLFYVNLDKWNYTPPSPIPGPSTKSTPLEEDEYCELQFTSYTGGTQRKKKKVEAERVTFRWKATGAPDGTQYNLSIIGLDDKENSLNKKGLRRNSFSAELPNGAYRVTVTSSICRPATTYLEVDAGGGGGGFFLFLLVMGAGVGGYIAFKKYKKNQSEAKNDRGNTNHTGTTNTNSGSNSQTDFDGF
ncbi:MAG: hypothetical protein AAFN93_14650 [Bacteroidota bacterium]